MDRIETLPFIASWVFYRTNWGLNVRAVGDNPQATATAGLPVLKLKYQAVILSGLFAALGGCVLTLGEVGYFASGGMTAGRGFVVLAAVVVGGWVPGLGDRVGVSGIRCSRCSPTEDADCGLSHPIPVLPDVALSHHSGCASRVSSGVQDRQRPGVRLTIRRISSLCESELALCC